jgi:predicted PurR-regulated permease PerM
LNELSVEYGVDLAFSNMEELRSALMETLRQNAGKITQSSQILTKQFFHLLVGTFVALLAFLDHRREASSSNYYDVLKGELALQTRRFTDSFEKVIGAQVAISAVNTFLTAMFLWTMDFPYLPFLVLATFLLGLLPIVGNLMSNTVIVFTGLTISPTLAFWSLLFLVFIHKLEYFLNSKIVGANIRTPMWQTLLGILVGHTVMGVPGIILAPALLHYARGEMQGLPAGPVPRKRPRS